jgi:hypothetical protein
MSTHGQTADADAGQMWGEGRGERLELAREAGWGGVSWRSVIAGVLVAYGLIGAGVGIAAAVLYPMGFTLESLSDDDWRRVGLIAALTSAALFFGAFTFGGYTAGRMASRAGLRNGALVLALGVILLAVVAAVARLEGATPAIVDRLESLGAPTDGTTWYGLGLLTGAVALGAMTLGALLGGVRGERWHQRLLVRAANPDIGPEAEARAEAERQRLAAERALARAQRAGVIEVPESTDTFEQAVRRVPARDGDEDEDQSERREWDEEPASTAAGPSMPSSSRSSGP